MYLKTQILILLFSLCMVRCGAQTEANSRESSTSENGDTSNNTSEDSTKPKIKPKVPDSAADQEGSIGNEGGNTDIINPPKPPSIVGCHKASAFICKVEALLSAKTNKYRASQGRSPLTHDEKYSFVSRDWSQKQGVRGSIGHDGFPAARNAVYKTEFGVSPSFGGENVAMTSGIRVSGEDDASAEKIAETFAVMWWNSSGHRANMLRSGFTRIGNGVYQNSRGAWYATQLFK